MDSNRNRLLKYAPGKNIFLLISMMFFICLITTEARAADLEGSKDHPLLKRFRGSEIVGYDTKRFDEYELQTSTFKN